MTHTLKLCLLNPQRTLSNSFLRADLAFSLLDGHHKANESLTAQESALNESQQQVLALVADRFCSNWVTLADDCWGCLAAKG